PYMIGLATALRIAAAERPSTTQRLTALRHTLIDGVVSRVSGAHLTGHPTSRVAHNASFVFEGVEGEALLLALDQVGICASTGSACTSGSLEASHVLKAMGLSPELAQGSLRLSLGKDSTEDDVHRVLEALPATVERLRAVLPVR